LAVSAVMAQENYATAWSGHKNVIVNTDVTGVTTPVTGFPLLIRLDSSHAAIFAQSRAGGVDVRFTKQDNVTRLPHQIESWESAGLKPVLWMRAETLAPGRNSLALRMHWGNGTAADSSSAQRVFGTAQGFQAVWHMGGTADEDDATANGFTAVQNGVPLTAPGVIGSARVVSSGNYFRADG